MSTALPLRVNAEQIDVPVGWTVRDLVAERLGRPVGDDGRAEDGSPLGIAVALDDAVVPRSRWGTTALAGSARCEIVTAAQGG